VNDFAAVSALSLAKAIRDKKVSSVEVTKAAIERLQAADALTHCTITLETDEALAAARAADAAVAKGTATGALAGVPLAHKDMFDRKGKIASWGANIRADHPAPEDATAIARLKASGALQIATLHLAEFAYGPTGHNYVLGHARNPWDPTRITGGSSAGTAAAVAYGAIPAGLGSDTGGSLRLPAACCGIVSIKPTWGRVSRAGAMPLSPALDTIGVLARHVEDLGLVLRLLAGPDARDPSASALPVPDYVARLDDRVAGVRFGIDETLLKEAHPSVQRMVENVATVLDELGLQRGNCRFADWHTLDHLVQLVQLPDASAAHAAFLRTRPNDYGPQVRARRGRTFYRRGRSPHGAARARHVSRTRARRDVSGHRYRSPAGPGRSACEHRRARHQRWSQGASRDGPRR
jgi:aspartyl-tRNA(Asn)/glutamyl-tRNA(Gln) amidotransferase subunit A